CRPGTQPSLLRGLRGSRWHAAGQRGRRGRPRSTPTSLRPLENYWKRVTVAGEPLVNAPSATRRASGPVSAPRGGKDKEDQEFCDLARPVAVPCWKLSHTPTRSTRCRHEPKSACRRRLLLVCDCGRPHRPGARAAWPAWREVEAARIHHRRPDLQGEGTTVA